MNIIKNTLICLALTSLTFNVQSKEYINILTGGTSGVYYPLGVAISKLLGENMENIKVQVQATKASVANLKLLQSRRGELAFALADSVDNGWQGNKEAGFRKPLNKLRAIGAIYPNYIHIVARKDSGIKTLADLKGKRVSVGAPKSGTELNARVIFKAAGLGYQDFDKTEYLPYGESVELLKNRQLDATLQSSGLGMAAFRDLAATTEVNFIPIPKEIVEKINSNAYQSALIPANTYDHQTQNVVTIAIPNILVTSTNVSDKTAYIMAKTVFENINKLSQAHSAAKGIKMQTAAKNLPIPLHQGAKRFFEEKGLID